MLFVSSHYFNTRGTAPMSSRHLSSAKQPPAQGSEVTTSFPYITALRPRQWAKLCGWKGIRPDRDQLAFHILKFTKGKGIHTNVGNVLDVLFRSRWIVQRRCMNSPITPSCITIDLEKQIVLRATALRSAQGVRLIRVRKVKCFRSICCVFRFPTV